MPASLFRFKVLRAAASRLADRPFLLLMAGLAYVLSPIDLIPEAFWGRVGMIDDLLVVAAIVWLLRRRRRPAP